MDPFTGASRYQASPAPAASAPSSEYMDPFTGASRYSGAPQATANASAPPFQPVVNHNLQAYNMMFPLNLWLFLVKPCPLQASERAGYASQILPVQ